MDQYVIYTLYIYIQLDSYSFCSCVLHSSCLRRIRYGVARLEVLLCCRSNPRASLFRVSAFESMNEWVSAWVNEWINAAALQQLVFASRQLPLARPLPLPPAAAAVRSTSGSICAGSARKKGGGEQPGREGGHGSSSSWGSGWGSDAILTGPGSGSGSLTPPQPTPCAAFNGKWKRVSHR